MIGDVVGSRRHADRRRLQGRLDQALAASIGHSDPIQAPTMTIGDEFQGIYSSMDDALRATFVIQVAMVGQARIRFGLGHGPIVRLDDRGPFGQDGPAWWDARAAIDAVKEAEESYGSPPHWSTAVGGDDPSLDPHRRYLQLRDHVLAGIDEVDADIVRGLMQGDTQTAIAARLDIDKGAVSRRVGRHGISALLWSLPEVRDA